MIRRRAALIGGTAALLLLSLFGAALLLAGKPAGLPARAVPDRPPLLLLTSLPIVFGERFSLEQGGSPALTALETRYRVLPIAVADPSELRQGSLLLMAHAAAQPAENLVALDAWVRAGGRLLLLADAGLEWESGRPLGDRLRPSPMFPDTGLLARWGLRLESPKDRGPADRRLADVAVSTLSPGDLSGSCKISGDRFVADCRVGKGRVVVVADADFLDAGRFSSGPENLQALLSALADLERQ